MRSTSLVVAVFCLFTLGSFGNTAKADTMIGHAMKMARRGSIWHDRSRGASRENVAKVRPGFGQRMRAYAAWMRSPGHRRNLMSGPGRTVCVNGYCVWRSRR